MLNDFDQRHQEYRRLLQNLIEQLKSGDTNIQSDLLDLDWAVRNDLYRLEILGSDAFEEEYDELVKFVPVIDAIKKKYNMNYEIDESSFDDYEEEDEEEDEEFESDFTPIADVEEDVELDETLIEGELIEGEFLDLFPEFDDLDEINESDLDK